MHRIPLLASFILIGLTLSAQAQDTDRFSLEKSGDGFVRLDRRTGEISTCQDHAGQLVCRVAADERGAMQDELDRLGAGLSSLEARVGLLEEDRSQLPTGADMNRTMDTVQQFFRGFMGIVKEFRDEFDGDEKTVPQRT